jgi:N-acetylmuramoyl-L-alanine amidase
MDGEPHKYQFDLNPSERPSLMSVPEKWYPGISDVWRQSSSNRIYHSIEGIRAIVIQATAGSSSAGAISVMKRGRASFHWLIPDENEDQHEKFIWACVPEALAAWHVQNSKSHPDVWAGKNRINHWSLGIEIVNSQSPTDFFSDWQIMVTAQIVRRCWAKYPNLRHVVSHAKIDPTRRSDPGVNFPWSKFRDLVLSSEIDMLDMYLGVPAVRDISPEQEISGCCEG